jgi:hypothetical protein
LNLTSQIKHNQLEIPNSKFSAFLYFPGAISRQRNRTYIRDKINLKIKDKNRRENACLREREKEREREREGAGSEKNWTRDYERCKDPVLRVLYCLSAPVCPIMLGVDK